VGHHQHRPARDQDQLRPLANAEVTERGLSVPFDKATVKDVPNVDPDDGHLARQEERGLYEYYGLEYSKGNDMAAP